MKRLIAPGSESIEFKLQFPCTCAQNSTIPHVIIQCTKTSKYMVIISNNNNTPQSEYQSLADAVRAAYDSWCDIMRMHPAPSQQTLARTHTLVKPIQPRRFPTTSNSSPLASEIVVQTTNFYDSPDNLDDSTYIALYDNYKPQCISNLSVFNLKMGTLYYCAHNAYDLLAFNALRIFMHTLFVKNNSKPCIAIVRHNTSDRNDANNHYCTRSHFTVENYMCDNETNNPLHVRLTELSDAYDSMAYSVQYYVRLPQFYITYDEEEYKLMRAFINEEYRGADRPTFYACDGYATWQNERSLPTLRAVREFVANHP